METPFEIPPVTPGRRRHFTVAQKRALLAEAASPGGSISAVARKYGIAPNMMFQWRRAMDDAGDEPRHLDGADFRDLMAKAVEARFGDVRTPHPVHWLCDNGPPYTAS